MRCGVCTSLFFFFNDTATTEIYTLSLHDALPISKAGCTAWHPRRCICTRSGRWTPCSTSWVRSRGSSSSTSKPCTPGPSRWGTRSEEHTSELQSRLHLVCRLLLEKKKKKSDRHDTEHS